MANGVQIIASADHTFVKVIRRRDKQKVFQFLVAVQAWNLSQYGRAQNMRRHSKVVLVIIIVIMVVTV